MDPRPAAPQLRSRGPAEAADHQPDPRAGGGLTVSRPPQPDRDASPHIIRRIRPAGAFSKGLLRDLVEIFVLALGLYILATTTVQTVRVVGSSMYPSLHDGDLLIASKLDYRLHPIERGDIIILKDPLDPSRDFIKRVVGLPGDRIQIHDHSVLVNGAALREPYIQAPWVTTGDWPGPGPGDARVVPKGSYFVLGDNRDHSSDSRVFNAVKQDAVDGKAVVRFWPFQRLEVFNVRPTLTKPSPATS